MTRADASPDADALAMAVHHAREACRLDPTFGEAWATLGFVLDRAGQRLDARAAARRAVALEPDNWRHHFRLASVSWGEARLRAAHRALALLPGFPLAHWLAATVYVARQVSDEAERELQAGFAGQGGGPHSHARFSPVALHWLHGLLRLARGDEAGALDAFERELSLKTGSHLYARECGANTWYAIGALRLRQQRRADAAAAFECALQRVATHPTARAGLAAATGSQGDLAPVRGVFESALSRAVQLTLGGAHADAAALIDDALRGDIGALPDNAGWIVPIEPLLHVTARPGIWTAVLTRLRNRAA
jgi:tetratricopeptide (TPR) repeat protein